MKKYHAEDGLVEIDDGWSGSDMDVYLASDVDVRLAADAKRIEQLEEAVRCAKVELHHASIFVRTREKMHPDGIYLYDQLRVNLEMVLP